MQLIKITFAFLAIGGIGATGYALFKLSHDAPAWVRALSTVMGVAALISALVVLPQALDAVEQSIDRVGRWFVPSEEELRRRAESEASRKAEEKARRDAAEEAVRRRGDEERERASLAVREREERAARVAREDELRRQREAEEREVVAKAAREADREKEERAARIAREGELRRQREAEEREAAAKSVREAEERRHAEIERIRELQRQQYLEEARCIGLSDGRRPCCQLGFRPSEKWSNSAMRSVVVCEPLAIR
jgi:hypothetical protein